MNPEAAPIVQFESPVRLSQQYDMLATAEDVFFCFRLLLGRHPDASEWEGHCLQIGYGLEDVVSSYLNSLEFSRRGLTRSETMNDLSIVQFTGFRVYADPKDPIIGAQIAKGNYEPEIVALFRQILQPGMGVLDIGANIGFFSMLAASLVGANGFVLAVEPNPANVRMIEASRQLNGFEQATVLQLAAGAKAGLLAFHATHSTGVTSPVAAGGQSVFDTKLVTSLPLDSVLPGHSKIDLIKIDVDGSEYHALAGLRGLIARDRPIIITEFFPGGLHSLSGIDGYAYLQWLAGLGYRICIIEADGSTCDVIDADHVARVLEMRGSDHLDLLCHPAEMERASGPTDAAVRNRLPGIANEERLSRATQQCRDLETELTWLRGHLEAANLHAREAEDRARRATRETMAATAQTAAVEGAMTELRKVVEAAESRERQALSLLAALQTSTSWQLTAPLRAAVSRLRRQPQK